MTPLSEFPLDSLLQEFQARFPSGLAALSQPDSRHSFCVWWGDRHVGLASCHRLAHAINQELDDEESDEEVPFPNPVDPLQDSFGNYL